MSVSPESAADLPAAPTPDRSRVLVGGLPPRRAGTLAQGFAAEGMVPTLAFLAHEIRDLLAGQTFDLVTLPASLIAPTDGNGLTEELHRAGTPVLVLDADRASLPALGATRHGAMPVNARVRDVVFASAALLDGAENGSARQHSTLRWGPIELDVSRRLARCRSEDVALTKLQFRLLEALVQAHGAVVTREALERAVYGEPTIDDGERIVAHVRRVRNRIETDPASPELLLTVRGEGFRLAD